MKATKLIKLLEEQISKHGDIDVYVEIPGFNAEAIYSIGEYGHIEDYVKVENLNEYSKEMIFEEWGDNTGLVWAARIKGLREEYING